MNRATLALVTYWVLFVIAPLAICFYLLGATARAAGTCMAIFVVLCIIGERGFRLWKKLWKIDR
jgi:ABC-type transport system involved in multi-copper enzyme maturation permease subunit